MAQDLHQWKTDRFAAMAAAGEIPARDGVFDWLDDLGRHQVRLAVATTGSRRWVLPLLDKTFGVGRFEVVVAGDDVAHRKPDPEAYLRTLERLGVTETQVVAVEDSQPGWEAAANAHVTCVVVANEETDLDPATGPAGPPLVLDGFGPQAAVVTDRWGVVKSGMGPAELLEQLLARAIMER
jgi:HAD superfamily hydrolase (TIGR01509 family)